MSTNPSTAAESTPRAAAQARPHTLNLIAGTVGHFVEWYDWYVYGLMAAIFAPHIFPSDSRLASLLAAFLTYAIGFIIRPMSGFIISPLADRFGRRIVLSLSVSGMALGALIIGLTPGYETIGVAAPILFVIARVMQGISAGGEAQSAISFMVEHAPAHRRGLYGSFSNTASGLATLAATGAAALSTAAFSPETLDAWGWRVPFIVGGVLGIFGLVLRTHSDESPEYEAQSKSNKKSSKGRVGYLLRHYPKQLLQTAALSAPAVAYYTWATFLPTYAELTSGRDNTSTLAGSVIGLCILVVVVPFCGWLSDRIGRRLIFPIIGAIGMVVLFYPLMMALRYPGFGVYVAVAASGWVVLGIWQAVYPTIQAELFPASLRVSGIGVAHQFVIATLGGTAPLIATAFINAGHPNWIPIYMSVIVLICLLIYFTIPETGSRTPRATVAMDDREVIEGEQTA